MAKATPCQTDGCIYGIILDTKKLRINITFPENPMLSPSQKELLIANAHNALELVLRPHFGRDCRQMGNEAIRGYPFNSDMVEQNYGKSL